MDLPTAIDRMRPAVVQITFSAVRPGDVGEVRYFNPPIHHVCGTGFIVNEYGDVITANHVIQGAHAMYDAITARQKHLYVGFALPNLDHSSGIRIRGNFIAFEFDVLAQDELHDLALLQLHENPFERQNTPQDLQPLNVSIAPLHTARPREGVAVAISGYPLGEPVMITTSGAMASVWAIDADSVSDTFIADVQANPGNSGGPVYRLEDGAVIAVCVAGQLSDVRMIPQDVDATLPLGVRLLQDAGLTIVAPARYVAELLEQENRPWLEAGTK